MKENLAKVVDFLLAVKFPEFNLCLLWMNCLSQDGVRFWQSLFCAQGRPFRNFDLQQCTCHGAPMLRFRPPFPGIFSRMPSGLSAAKRRKYHFRRALRVIVMALNFWWSGSCFIPLEHLKRTPSPSQHRLLRRLAGLVLADGPSESFQVLASGRRFPQLVARLSELTTRSDQPPSPHALLIHTIGPCQ